MDVGSTVTSTGGTRLAWAEVGAPDGAPVLYFHGTPSCSVELGIGPEGRPSSATGWPTARGS